MVYSACQKKVMDYSIALVSRKAIIKQQLDEGSLGRKIGISRWKIFPIPAPRPIDILWCYNTCHFICTSHLSKHCLTLTDDPWLVYFVISLDVSNHISHLLSLCTMLIIASKS